LQQARVYTLPLLKRTVSCRVLLQLSTTTTERSVSNIIVAEPRAALQRAAGSCFATTMTLKSRYSSSSSSFFQFHSALLACGHNSSGLPLDTKLINSVSMAVLAATCCCCCCCQPHLLLDYFYQAMGMNISSEACLQTLEFNAFDLLTIEGDACLEHASAVAGITYTAHQQGDKFPLGTMSIKVRMEHP
jgi:hypothetical protein